MSVTKLCARSPLGAGGRVPAQISTFQRDYTRLLRGTHAPLRGSGTREGGTAQGAPASAPARLSFCAGGGPAEQTEVGGKREGAGPAKGAQGARADPDRPDSRNAPRTHTQPARPPPPLAPAGGPGKRPQQTHATIPRGGGAGAKRAAGGAPIGASASTTADRRIVVCEQAGTNKKNPGTEPDRQRTGDGPRPAPPGTRRGAARPPAGTGNRRPPLCRPSATRPFSPGRLASFLRADRRRM